MREEVNIEDFRVPDKNGNPVPLVADSDVVVEGYDRNLAKIDPAARLCVAKTGSDEADGSKSYWLKVCQTGEHKGRLFDVLTQSTDDLNKHDHYTGRYRYEFQRVTEEAFNTYLHFISTSNPAHLRIAERMVHERS